MNSPSALPWTFAILFLLAVIPCVLAARRFPAHPGVVRPAVVLRA